MHAEYLPLWIAGEIRGRVRRDLVPMVAACVEIEAAEIGLKLRDETLSRPLRSRMLQSIARQLRKRGLIADWRNELCAVQDSTGTEIARCERGVFRTLGIQNRAVHVNGLCSDGRWWIARRSAQKRADPGKLDNLAAGGVSAGETARGTAIRELWEEAGVSRALAQRVDFPGMVIRSVRETQFGIHDELVIVADLMLPDDFEPNGRDGEVEEFLCLSREQVQAALAREEFTVEAAIATQECLERRAEPVPRR
ncbi:MAG: NUDIX hydrolase [Steroidobacteraceae bacterium]